MFNDQYFETMLNFVLLREGGYVNGPDDPGGETNHGITHEVYDSYRRSTGYISQEKSNEL